METDYSREIYSKYYNVKNRTVVITLKDNTVFEGRLVSFIHGDADEPFIIKWHFVDKNEIESFQQGLDISIGGNRDSGQIIKQKDIKNVRFKD
jgi:hypothetical protein